MNHSLRHSGSESSQRLDRERLFQHPASASIFASMSWEAEPFPFASVAPLIHLSSVLFVQVLR
jgi:hypothetical protein